MPDANRTTDALEQLDAAKKRIQELEAQLEKQRNDFANERVRIELTHHLDSLLGDAFGAESSDLIEDVLAAMLRRSEPTFDKDGNLRALKLGGKTYTYLGKAAREFVEETPWLKPLADANARLGDDEGPPPDSPAGMVARGLKERAAGQGGGGAKRGKPLYESSTPDKARSMIATGLAAAGVFGGKR